MGLTFDLLYSIPNFYRFSLRICQKKRNSQNFITFISFKFIHLKIIDFSFHKEFSINFLFVRLNLNKFVNSILKHLLESSFQSK